jgi:hypothetical protein
MSNSDRLGITFLSLYVVEREPIIRVTIKASSIEADAAFGEETVASNASK